EADRRRAVDNRPTRQPQDPNSTTRYAARQAVVPTRARDRRQQEEQLQAELEQDQSEEQVLMAPAINHYPDFMPDGITIEEQAKIIFARFK
ncbi:hypothetical protein GGH12_004826, partial [Coemansia sp. RSA 1822]